MEQMYVIVVEGTGTEVFLGAREECFAEYNALEAAFGDCVIVPADTYFLQGR